MKKIIVILLGAFSIYAFAQYTNKVVPPTEFMKNVMVHDSLQAPLS